MTRSAGLQGRPGLLWLFSAISLLAWGGTAIPDFPTWSWEPVRGTVVSASMSVVTKERAKGADIHVVTATVRLRYDFRGKEWISDLSLPLARNWKPGDDRTSDYVPEYPPGKVLHVFAHPEDPVRLAPRRGPHPATWVALVFALGFAALAWRFRR